MAELLSDGEIDAGLAERPGWRRSGDELSRTVESESFPAAIDLVRRVAEVAEELNHHPDIDIRWRKVTYRVTTHSAGGITQLDLDLVSKIDDLIAS
ncbi:4a-hydroxytetrahydrobiopterin dehydratase [Rhodococcus sp. HNM0569]|uniref:4a-hydroxytetrahydrobiopterin dehydratase n=1 Tax=Rhodococcus sp. HNM0569 TaxID=2716340 RepID=UPI00146C10B3|nr:4a-hydroxytetrahydrobiopterin dehydratase [Rhodococcus sp. HNM0569]NLU83834.1 4a-hydroxytetrahydrobiopterin dehydratase [Rhodococcus sp. HNM0569]